MSAASAPNPNNERVCLARMDPRQRGLFGVAWALGYVACFARAGLEAITMGAATGPAGMIYRRTEYPQPYFDTLSGPALYPVYHLLADLAAASGSRLIASKSADEGAVATLAYRGNAGPILWLANLSANDTSIRIRGFIGRTKLVMLDEGSFARATTDADFLKKAGKTLNKVAALSLRPYAIARLSAIAE
jgi:hypothetical protein